MSRARRWTEQADSRHLRELLAEGRLPECWVPLALPDSSMSARQRPALLGGLVPAVRAALAKPLEALRQSEPKSSRPTRSPHTLTPAMSCPGWPGAPGPAATYVVHGEASAAAALRDRLDHELGWTAVVPALGERVTIRPRNYGPEALAELLAGGGIGGASSRERALQRCLPDGEGPGHALLGVAGDSA